MPISEMSLLYNPRLKNEDTQGLNFIASFKTIICHCDRDGKKRLRPCSELAYKGKSLCVIHLATLTGQKGLVGKREKHCIGCIRHSQPPPCREDSLCAVSSLIKLPSAHLSTTEVCCQTSADRPGVCVSWTGDQSGLTGASASRPQAKMAASGFTSRLLQRESQTFIERFPERQEHLPQQDHSFLSNDTSPNQCDLRCHNRDVEE